MSDNTDRIPQLRAALADALPLGAEGIEGGGDSTLFEMVLMGLAEAIRDQASAVLHLSNGEYARSSKTLLRTLIEAWIIARYVAADATGSRAAAYIMNESGNRPPHPNGELAAGGGAVTLLLV